MASGTSTCYDFTDEDLTLITPVFEGDMNEPWRGARSGAVNDDGSRVAFFTGRDYVPWDQITIRTSTGTTWRLTRTPTWTSTATGSSIGSDLDNLFMTGDGSSVVSKRTKNLPRRTTTTTRTSTSANSHSISRTATSALRVTTGTTPRSRSHSRRSRTVRTRSSSRPAATGRTRSAVRHSPVPPMPRSFSRHRVV